MHGNLIIILGDQLDHSISSLENFDKKHDRILMMEVLEEATYVKHHPYKIILIFSAMRHFANELKQKGYHVDYIPLNDINNRQSFTKNLENYIKNNVPQEIIITEAGEYRIQSMINRWNNLFGIPVIVNEDNRFYCSIADFKAWADGKKLLRMENFYRIMRKKTGILTCDGKPIGGKWNFDTDNRKVADPSINFKALPSTKPDKITNEVIKIVKDRFSSHFGSSDDFDLAVTHQEATERLNFFCKHHLSEFGTYQDAMLNGEYNLHHSQLSMYINIGLLTPKQVIDKVLVTYKKNKIALHNIEGYIRQILGWREYMRGMYWLKMPDYKKLNYFNNKQNLPNFYWTAKTSMACMKHALQQTYDTATSHHIQRLMITGNYALLFGVHPDHICEWYLAVYADAFEWVELTNTLGMSQFADGGIIASKPYVCSGNYINKMSNFCKDCCYNVKNKLEDNACPFNFLYWAFLIQHEKKLRINPRMTFAYRYIDKMSEGEKKSYLQRAKKYKENPEK